jgi:hypothetical protein
MTGSRRYFHRNRDTTLLDRVRKAIRARHYSPA